MSALPILAVGQTAHRLGAKERGDDVWTWVAIDADSQLVPAIALHYACYNFCKIHKTIRCTPAMEAGVVTSQWTVRDLVDMMEA